MASPGARAVLYEHGSLTYGELEARANQLAHRLRRLGARRGATLGICLERSPEMLIALLAVLKSGAAYVPLDPGSPRLRLQAMLDDSGPAAIITQPHLARSLPAHAAHVVLLDGSDTGDEPCASLEQDVSGFDPAYVMYTSGSTGEPKGVLVTHGSLSNHLLWRSRYFPLGPEDRCLQKAPLSFDDSVWEILEPLSAGACVVLARPHLEQDSAHLVELLAARGITAACFVPSVLRVLVEEPRLDECRALRRLSTGGETVSRALVRQVRERLPQVALYNGYGATETTIAATFWNCADASAASTVPIGRPIFNTQVYLLDDERRLLAPGVTGELYVGGAGLASGYLNRPDLTAACFLDVCIEGATTRLYRTGDLGRLGPDGVFEFVGRLDDQVKVRGVRVELGEVEAALSQHAQVKLTCVVCLERPDGQKRLIAHVVPRTADAPSPLELREFLRERVPAAMIPARFVDAVALPLTASGKIDRRRLLSLAQAEEDKRVEHTAPRDDIESRLMALWQEALATRPIGLDEDFFALGGDSLSMVRLALAIETSFGCGLPPNWLFEAPTITQQAERLRTGMPAEARGPLLPLTAGGAGMPLFVAHHGDGNVIGYQPLAQLLGGERPIYALQAKGLAEHIMALPHIESVVAQYVQRIRAVQPHGPYAIAGFSSGGLIAFEIAQQLSAAGERIGLLAILDTDAHLERGLLDQVRLQLDTLRRLPRGHRLAYVRRNLPHWLERLRTQWLPVRSPRDGAASDDRIAAPMERALNAYRPRVYPGVVTLFRATERGVTTTYGRTLGWRRLARGGVRVIDVSGDHNSILQAHGAVDLARKLRACLAECTSVGGPES